MFKNPINYFQNQGTKKSYPSTSEVYDWVEQAPPQNLLKAVKSGQESFIRKINNYQIVKRNYQDEINKQYASCLTLEKVYKSNIQLQPATTYQTSEANNLNAQDAKDLLQAAKETIIKQQAEKTADQQIQEYYKKINDIKAKQNKEGENK